MGRIHPNLKRQLADAVQTGRKAKGAAARSRLEVVIQLKPAKGKKLEPPEECRRRAESLLRRVETITHEAPEDFNIFANMQSLVVRASALFLKALLEQPEVNAAVANRSPIAGS